MEPPLKSRFPWIIPGPLQKPRFGRATFPPLPLASLIEHCQVEAQMMTCLGLQGNAKSLSRRPADEFRLRHVPASRAVPGLGRRKASARTLCSPSASVTRPCFLSALPVTGAAARSFRVRVWAFSAIRR